MSLSLYVAGPMRGYEQFNFPAFHEATKELREAGYVVFSPAEEDLRNGFVPDSTVDFSETSYQEAMRRDIRLVLEVAGIATLEGWENSTGANVEVTVARAIGIPVHSVEQWLATKALMDSFKVRS